MSHVPSAAMPHAKPHEHEPATASPAPRESVPWAALAAGGVLAIGGAITAAWLLRGGKRKRTSAKAARGKSRAGKPRKAKASAGSDG